MLRIGLLPAGQRVQGWDLQRQHPYGCIAFRCRGRRGCDSFRNGAGRPMPGYTQMPGNGIRIVLSRRSEMLPPGAWQQQEFLLSCFFRVLRIGVLPAGQNL